MLSHEDVEDHYLHLLETEDKQEKELKESSPISE
jgi:hypothetical protein